VCAEKAIGDDNESSMDIVINAKGVQRTWIKRLGILVLRISLFKKKTNTRRCAFRSMQDERASVIEMNRYGHTTAVISARVSARVGEKKRRRLILFLCSFLCDTLLPALRRFQ
jgi:hypothetical protein